MKPATRDRLLALNRQFYADVAEPFHRTRQSWPPGNLRLLDYAPLSCGAPEDASGVLQVLDAGCGNGRLAAVLDSLGRPVRYTGVDANAPLLERARELAAELVYVDADFVQADLTEPDWTAQLGGPTRRWNMVMCLSTLQHMPGWTLRAQVMRSLTGLVAPNGRLAVSAWQFLTSPRLAARQIAWETVGVDTADVESGDALLPWKQGAYAIRYVHQIDKDEMAALAADAGLTILDAYAADGKSGDLNLYAIMQATAG